MFSRFYNGRFSKNNSMSYRLQPLLLLWIVCIVFVFCLNPESISASSPLSVTTALQRRLTNNNNRGVFEPTVLSVNSSSNNRSMSSSSDVQQQSSVLRELKETIQRQAAEIDSLKKTLQSSKKSGGGISSHGHGGGSEEASPSDIEKYLNSSFYQIAFRRVPWLSLFLVSLSMTTIIMNGFEHTLSKQIELAYFVPLLIGHGGNTGGQTVGTVLSALSTGSVTTRDATRIILREAMSGLTIGITLGCVVGPFAHFLGGIPIHVATAIFCALPVLSTIAATLASSIPFACKLAGLDPAIIAAPAMTTLTDVTGLLSYFMIANQVFKFFGIDL